MTDLEKATMAYQLLLQRFANITVELNNAQVEAEAQKRRADALQAQIDVPAPVPPKIKRAPRTMGNG